MVQVAFARGTQAEGLDNLFRLDAAPEKLNDLCRDSQTIPCVPSMLLLVVHNQDPDTDLSRDL